MLCSAVSDVLSVSVIFNDDLVVGAPSSRRFVTSGRLDVAEAVLLGLLDLDVVHVVRHGHADRNEPLALNVDLAIPAVSATAARRLGTPRRPFRRATPRRSARCG